MPSKFVCLTVSHLLVVLTLLAVGQTGQGGQGFVFPGHSLKRKVYCPVLTHLQGFDPVFKFS